MAGLHDNGEATNAPASSHVWWGGLSTTLPTGRLSTPSSSTVRRPARFHGASTLPHARGRGVRWALVAALRVARTVEMVGSVAHWRTIFHVAVRWRRANTRK